MTALVDILATPLATRMVARCSSMLCTNHATKVVLVPFCDGCYREWQRKVRSGRVAAIGDPTRGAGPG